MTEYDSYLVYLEGLGDAYYDWVEKCIDATTEFIRKWYKENGMYLDELQFSLFMEEFREQFYAKDKFLLNPNKKHPELKKYFPNG